MEEAMMVGQRLAGYDRFLKSFEVTAANVGNINSMPKSLFVQIKATHPAIIDAAWWWNPLADGKPSLSWDDFMESYAVAEAAMAKHPWLQDWKNLSQERSLELHLMGGAIDKNPSALETDVIPVWRHAGFSGEPTYRLLARRNYGLSWVEIYFSDRDERALVTTNSSPDPKSPSMMERADVSWHPKGKAGEKYSKYAIIENDGRCHVETFVAESPKSE